MINHPHPPPFRPGDLDQTELIPLVSSNADTLQSMKTSRACSPYRYSVDLARYLQADRHISVTQKSQPSRPASVIIEEDESDFRASLDRLFGDVEAAPGMADRTRPWYRPGKQAAKLQRQPSTASSIDPATLIRKSPIEFEDDFSVPVPPPPRRSDSTLRPPAARNASSGTIRRTSLEIHSSPSAAQPSKYRVVCPKTPDTVRSSARIQEPEVETTPLPGRWSVAHDRAICVLDARGYTLNQSIRKLRRAFPELAGCCVTPGMIDRRLRTLDQIVECDYWRIGLEFTSRHDENGQTGGAPSTVQVRGNAALLSSGHSTRGPCELSTSYTSMNSSCSLSSIASSDTSRSTLPGGRRKAGSLLGLNGCGDTSFQSKVGRPMSMIEERPGSTASVDGASALLPALQEDQEPKTVVNGTAKSPLGWKRLGQHRRRASREESMSAGAVGMPLM